MAHRPFVATVRTVLLIMSGGLGLGALAALPDCGAQPPDDRVVPGRVALDTGAEQLWRFSNTGDFERPRLHVLFGPDVTAKASQCTPELLTSALLHTSAAEEANCGIFTQAEHACQCVVRLEPGESQHELWLRTSPTGLMVEGMEVREERERACGFADLAALIIAAFLSVACLMFFTLWWHTDPEET